MHTQSTLILARNGGPYSNALETGTYDSSDIVNSYKWLKLITTGIFEVLVHLSKTSKDMGIFNLCLAHLFVISQKRKLGAHSYFVLRENITSRM